MKFPKITIVTPSFNQGQFLEETILSVLGQNYPNLEYIIIDGGSTDNSVEIIKKYEKHIAYWVSEKDKGQSHAINKGFAMATGDVLGWLNSDDRYKYDALNFIAKNINTDNSEIYCGNCIYFHEKNKKFKTNYQSIISFKSTNLELIDFITQPSSFWTKKVWDTVGILREDLHFGFDWEWFLRAKKSNSNFILVDEIFSIYRIHEAHKTGAGGKKRQNELLKIYEINNPYYAKLYSLLMSDKYVHKYTLDNIFLLFIFRLLNKKTFQGSLLKFRQPKVYKNYNSLEIDLARRML